MHVHVDQFDHPNTALAAGDREGAGTPTYWVSRHETVDGIDEDLQSYLDAMRRLPH